MTINKEHVQVSNKNEQLWHERGVQWIVSGASRFLLAEARAYLDQTRGSGVG